MTRRLAAILAVMEGLEKWRAHNGCAKQPREAQARKGGAGASAQTAKLMVWDGCTGGGAVAHWKLTGVGHGWPGPMPAALPEELIGPPPTLISAAEEAWKFFAQVSR